MGDYTLEQALALASENAGNTLDDAIHVNIDTREITVPQSQQLFGVESDADVEIKHIVIDGRYADGNRDLSKLAWRVIYRNANKETSYYLIPSVVANEDSIEMDWLIKRSVVAYKGTVDFILCAFATTSSGEVTPEWNTTLGQGTVLEGLETSAIDIGKESVDELAKILYETIAARDAAADSASKSAASAVAAAGSAGTATENANAAESARAAAESASASAAASAKRSEDAAIKVISEGVAEKLTEMQGIQEDVKARQKDVTEKQADVTANVELARQAALSNGYMQMGVDPDTGHLMYTRTTNLKDKIDFAIVNDTNLEVQIHG